MYRATTILGSDGPGDLSGRDRAAMTQFVEYHVD
jgi:hypothetical protein